MVRDVLFREVYPLAWILQNQIWKIELSCVIQCCMMIGWAYLAFSSFILFASNLKWLVTKIPKGLFSQLYFYMLISQRHYTKWWKLKLSPRSASFRTKARPWETFGLRLMLVKRFPLQHQSSCTYLKIHTTRSAIFMIYKHIYNHPFKKLMNRKYEGVEDLMSDSRETN
jgi:hypothetical protein